MKAGSVFLIFLGLSVAAIGGVFTYLMWDSYQRASAMHDWPQVDGVVLESEVEEWKHDEFSPMEYRLKILYGYQWEGVALSGDQYTSRGSSFSKERGNADGLVKMYSAGTKVPVFVFPEDPTIAVLKPDTKAAGYSIWFPLLFVIGGLGIVFKALVGSRGRTPGGR